MRAARQKSLRIDVPRPEQDRLPLSRVGIIAGVGFVIGIGWPHLAGVQLVPSPPLEPAPEPAEPKAAKPKQAAPSAPAPTPERETPSRLKVGEAKITSCRDDQGKTLDDCGDFDFDGIARPRLLALADCEAGEQAEGVLSIGFRVDFESGRIVDVLRGKSTTLPFKVVDGLVQCATASFDDAVLAGLSHRHQEYTIFYLVEFTPAPVATEAADPEQGAAEASGRATVGWNVALIRGAPNQDGEVVARLLSGTRVVVTARQGDWYKVKYDAKGNEGWVFKGAIGL